MISFCKLFKLLLDKKMKKRELAQLAHISTSSVTKMSNDRVVNSDVIAKVCIALECTPNDIMEIKKDIKNNE